MNKKEEEKIEKTVEKLKNLKTEKVIGCKNCHKTRCTLIKATNSYYCIDCFHLLNKKKFKDGDK